MSDLICSAILNSRQRPEGLKKLIRSLNQAEMESRSNAKLEIVVRIDNDDNSYSRDFWPTNVTFVVGPRYNGWKSSNIHLFEAAQAARGRWLFQLNDDAVVEGGDWLFELSKVPGDGFICQANYHELGPSSYTHVEGGAFPIVPNKFWDIFGLEGFEDPYDIWVDKFLRDAGWKTKFLYDLKTIHQRHNDEALEEHRKL